MIREDARLSDALEALDSGQPNKAFDLCTLRIERDGETAAALLLRSMCCVSMGQPQSAVDDNGRALNMLSLSGSELLAFADESAEYGLEPGYCASVMENAGRELERQAELQSRMLFSAANAYNRAGICRYRAGSPLELESADFERGRELLLQAQKAMPADRDDKLLLALVSSNLAECCFRGGDRARSRRLFDESSAAIEPYVNDGQVYLQQYSFCQSCLYDIDRADEHNVDAHHRMSRLIKIYESKSRCLTDEQRIALSACYVRRGNVRFQMGDYRGDVSDCTRAAELVSGVGGNPLQLAQIYFSRAEAYEQQEKLNKAAADYGMSASLLERSDKRDDSAQLIAMRRFLEACCYERVGENAAASRSYRLAAEAFSGFGEIPEDTSLPPSLSDREMAALCRYRCGMCLCKNGEKDYRGSFSELTAAYRILDAMEENMLLAGKKATIANSLGELYELFDDYDNAIAYFSLAEDLLRDLDRDSKKRVMAVSGQMLDPAGGVRRAAGEYGSLSDDDVISDDMYSDVCLNGADQYDIDEDIDDYFDVEDIDDGDEALDELLASLRRGLGGTPFDTGDEASAGDPSDDEAEDGAEYQEEPDDDGEIWKDASDDTPKG